MILWAMSRYGTCSGKLVSKNIVFSCKIYIQDRKLWSMWWKIVEQTRLPSLVKSICSVYIERVWIGSRWVLQLEVETSITWAVLKLSWKCKYSVIFSNESERADWKKWDYIKYKKGQKNCSKYSNQHRICKEDAEVMCSFCLLGSTMNSNGTSS